MSTQSAKTIMKIVDKSNFIATGGGTNVGAVITATKGPLNTIVTVNTVVELEDKFGEVSNSHIGLVCAKKYLEKGKKLNLVRVATGSVASAKTNLMSTTTPILSVDAKYPGTYGNKLKITVQSTGVGTAVLRVLEGTTMLEEKSISLVPANANYVEKVQFDHVIVSDLTDGASTTKSLEAGTFELLGGTDGTSDITTQDYIGKFVYGKATGAQAFRSTSVDLNLLVTFGVSDKLYCNELLSIAEERKDTFVVIDTPSGLTYQNAIDWAKGESSYSSTGAVTGWRCAVYWDWQKYTVNGKQILCPPSAYVAANMAVSDEEYGCQYPVAGFKRGIVTSEGMSDNPDVNVRDALVKNGINPIADMGALGIAIMGNDTRNPATSDLSAVHVVRELTKIMKAINDYTNHLYFELHNESTWNEWVDSCTSFLESEKTAQGIQWFDVKMDRTTMTDSDIANRTAKGVVKLQFFSDAEVFEISYQIENSGSSME